MQCNHDIIILVAHALLTMLIIAKSQQQSTFEYSMQSQQSFITPSIKFIVGSFFPCSSFSFCIIKSVLLLWPMYQCWWGIVSFPIQYQYWNLSVYLYMSNFIFLSSTFFKLLPYSGTQYARLCWMPRVKPQFLIHISWVFVHLGSILFLRLFCCTSYSCPYVDSYKYILPTRDGNLWVYI